LATIGSSDAAKGSQRRDSLFFLTDHYLNYPSILLRLARVTTPRLKELLEDSWRLVTKEKPRRR
jgi:hypothetical protein